jgi:hypothetical protein
MLPPRVPEAGDLLFGAVSVNLDGKPRLLATQTLTFLFTDIEGSTAMLQRLGDAYAGVLSAHHSPASERQAVTRPMPSRSQPIGLAARRDATTAPATA